MDLLPHIPTDNPWISVHLLESRCLAAPVWGKAIAVGKCMAKLPHHWTAAAGNWRDKNTKAHTFKIIYTPVLIDHKYMNVFQSSAFIMKQKTEPNFPESWPSSVSCPRWSRSVNAKCAGSAQQPQPPVQAQAGSTRANTTHTSPGPGQAELYGLKAAEMMISITT